jgi:hypothetical protein
MDTNPVHRSGLAAQLESQVYEFLRNIIREYLALHKSHVGFDRINGVISHAHTLAQRQVFEEINPPRQEP